MVSTAAVYPLTVMRTRAAVRAAAAKQSHETNNKSSEPSSSCSTTSTADPTTRLLQSIWSHANGVAVEMVSGGVEKFVYFYFFALFSKLQTVVTRSRQMGTVTSLVVGCSRVLLARVAVPCWTIDYCSLTNGMPASE